MMRFVAILMAFMLMSCYAIVSEFGENEEILSYTYYINEGWEAFESINLSDSLSSINYIDEQYGLAFEMFDVAIQAIDSEFSEQVFLGPYYKAYNGTGWAQLYYANKFMDPLDQDIRDSLRNEAILSFDFAISDLAIVLSDSVSSQDRCDIFLGYSYANYYRALIEDPIYFDLRGKIYLGRQDYNAAYNEINKIIDNCNPYINDVLDINLLFDCFDEFINNN